MFVEPIYSAAECMVAFILLATYIINIIDVRNFCYHMCIHKYFIHTHAKTS